MSASHKTLDCVGNLIDKIDKLPLEYKKALVQPALALLDSLAQDVNIRIEEVRTELSKFGSTQNDTI